MTGQEKVFADRLGHLSLGEMTAVDDALRATVPPGSLIANLGIELTHAGPGAARATMLVGREHLNQAGAAQAGAVVALADATAGWAAKIALRPGTSFTTLELKANLVRPAREGSVLVARAQPVHVGRTSMVFTVETRDGDDDGPLVALFSCTQLVLT